LSKVSIFLRLTWRKKYHCVGMDLLLRPFGIKAIWLANRRLAGHLLLYNYVDGCISNYLILLHISPMRKLVQWQMHTSTFNNINYIGYSVRGFEPEYDLNHSSSNIHDCSKIFEFWVNLKITDAGLNRDVLTLASLVMRLHATSVHIDNETCLISSGIIGLIDRLRSLSVFRLLLILLFFKQLTANYLLE